MSKPADATCPHCLGAGILPCFGGSHVPCPACQMEDAPPSSATAPPPPPDASRAERWLKHIRGLWQRLRHAQIQAGTSKRKQDTDKADGLARQMDRACYDAGQTQLFPPEEGKGTYGA